MRDWFIDWLAARTLCCFRSKFSPDPYISAGQLVLLEYNEDTNAVHEARSFQHPGEVWHVSPSPREAALAFTSYTTGNGEGSHECTLWRLPLSVAASSSLPTGTPASSSSPNASPARSPPHHGLTSGYGSRSPPLDGRPQRLEPLASLPNINGRVRRCVCACMCVRENGLSSLF